MLSDEIDMVYSTATGAAWPGGVAMMTEGRMHTPLPWKVEPSGEISATTDDGDFWWVTTDTDEDDARLIVDTVNHYPALKAAALAVVEAWDGGLIEPYLATRIDALRAVLNKGESNANEGT